MENTLHEKIRKDVANLESITPPNEEDCFYCGDKGTDWDHTIPHSFARSVGVQRTWSKDVVRACGDCNGLLSNLVHGSMYERLTYLCQRVKQRNKKLLKSADWTDEELVDMGEGLRGEILAKRRDKVVARHRIFTLERNAVLARSFEP